MLNYLLKFSITFSLGKEHSYQILTVTFNLVLLEGCFFSFFPGFPVFLFFLSWLTPQASYLDFAVQTLRGQMSLLRSQQKQMLTSSTGQQSCASDSSFTFVSRTNLLGRVFFSWVFIALSN